MEMRPRYDLVEKHRTTHSPDRQCFGMPGAAIRTGVVDYILPLDQIGPMLVGLSRNHSAAPTTVKYVKVSGGAT